MKAAYAYYHGEFLWVQGLTNDDLRTNAIARKFRYVNPPDIILLFVSRKAVEKLR